MSADLAEHVKNNRGKVSLSVVLVVSILALTGVFVFTKHDTVNAAAITSASDVLNNSAPGTATSTHTITFTTPTGIAANATMTITFPSGFDVNGVDFTDMDLDDGGDLVLADVPSGATWGATTSGDIVVTFTNGDTLVSPGATIEIQIGDNADSGDANFTNPTKSTATGTAQIFVITVGGGFGDSGDMLVAIIESVTVSVTIDETLAFGITSVDLGDCDTKFGSVVGGATTTTTTVPFGQISTTNDFYHACHDFDVSTNASSGYVLTAETDTSLKSGGSVLISNGVCDAGCSKTATDTWATDTLNGFAYTSTGTDSIIKSAAQFRTFACTGATTTDCLPSGGEAAETVMSNSGSVNNSTATIEYMLSLPGTQEAGTYTNTVTYIVTPTF